MGSMSRGFWKTGWLYIIASALLVVEVFPFLYVLSNSLRTPATAMRGFGLLPDEFHFENYITAWTMGNMGRYFGNSVLVTVTATSLTVFLAALAGYAFGRIPFWGNGLLFLVVLSAMIVPSQVLLIPLYLMLQRAGLLNSYAALILTYVAIQLPFSIFLFRNYFLTIPKELEDAARIDGCNTFRIFWNVMLPLALPAVATVAIFSFVADWSEFMYAMAFMTDPNRMTLPSGLVHFEGQYNNNWPLLFAAIVIIIVPILIVFLFLQRYFVRGLTAGAVKG